MSTGCGVAKVKICDQICLENFREIIHNTFLLQYIYSYGDGRVHKKMSQL